MQRFSISPENQIQVLREDDVPAESSIVFHSEKELLKLTNDWPAARLVEIWNRLPGIATVRKFTSRATAVTRIWKRIESIPPTPAKGAPRKSPKKLDDAAAPADTSKKAQVVALLEAAEGATLTELMSATGWQKHSIRGFLSGTVTKKMGLPVLSSKNGNGERVYRIQR